MSKPTCKLVGTDGNVFAIIANVSECLNKAQAHEFENRAIACDSYDEVLRVVMEYAEVV